MPCRRTVAPLVALALLPLAVAGTASAQVARFELGRRLQAFEELWERVDDAARARATPELVAATTAFFGLRLSAAAQRLDMALFALQAAAPASDEQAWFASLSCVPSRRFLDPAVDELTVRVQRLYDDDDDRVLPKGVRVRLALTAQGRNAVVAEVSLDAAETGVVLPVGDLGEGVFTLTCGVSTAERKLGEIAQPVVCAQGLAQRLAALTPITPTPATADDHDTATLRYLERLLAPAARGHTAETDLPYLALLRDAEAIVRARADGTSFVATAPRGERWLCLALGNRRLPVRIHAPAAGELPASRPLLLLLHGAGGSENMFFDTYGAGTYVARARERGWIVASPRSAGEAAADLVDALAAIYPVDRAKVYMVGHSMGAMQAIGVATGEAAPKFAAVAALGGGGRIARRADLTGRRFYVATGDQDFARAGARSLHDALERAKANVTWKEHVDTEHLGIVQRAAGDVFAWIENIGAAK